MIDIYIGDRGDKLDLSEDVRVLMTYELEKLQNPTIIKNNFSKTVTVYGTPNNNKIFGYYYKLDKVLSDGFDASKRADFKIFNGAELLESGYMQLNNIIRRDGVVEYQVTLYGGIGDFFFSLSYDEDGNERTLADLVYNRGRVSEDEFDFTMNFETVERAWNNIEIGSGIWSQINFIPSYNGLYEDFDNNKVFINTNNSNNFDPNKSIDSDSTFSTIYKDGTYYQLVNGFAMGELAEDMTEWEMRDLRSYKQRPALRTKTFLNAIANPENNGGYEVELDPTFFHKGNPYYEDTWIALPLLNIVENATTNNLTVKGESTSKINTTVPTASNPTEKLNGSSTVTIDSYTDTDGLINFYPYYGVNATLDINCDFKIKTASIYDRNKLYLSYYDRGFQWSALGVWLEAKSNGVVIGNSNCLIFSNNLYRGNNISSFSVDLLTGNGVGIPNTSYSIITGGFVKTGEYEDDWNGDRHYNYEFVDDNVSSVNSWQLNMKDLPNIKDMTIELRVARWYDDDNQITISTSPVQLMAYNPYLYDAGTGNSTIRTDGIYVEPIDFNGEIIINGEGKSLSNRLIKKKDLLKNQITPAALLLSYTKMFGLYFIKDVYTKKISILTRNTFFNGEVVDIDDRIDRSRDVTIQPIVYDKKWYMLKPPALECKYMEEYKSRFYNAEYGQKRLDTNFNFNLDTEDIYKDNKYQNLITVFDSSKYYRHYKNSGNYIAPPFAIEGFKYCLFSGKDSESIEFGNTYFVDFNNISTFTGVGGVDAMPKLCCFEEKNNKQSLKDINVTLVFYNGMKYLQDDEGRSINYTISDDMAEMFSINDMTPTYLYSESETDVNDNRICCITNSLPMFGRYYIENNNIVESLDFGVPLETYVNYNYPQEATLYDGFWRGLYEDQFSNNSRRVVANVLWHNKQGNESLRKFYYFDGCYWILNKIIDYDVSENNIQNVRCEFIKVNNIANYKNQKTYNNFNYVEIDFENCYLLSNSPSVLKYGDSYYAKVGSEYGIRDIKILMGGVDITNAVWNRTTQEINIPSVTDDVYGYVVGYGYGEMCNVQLKNNIVDRLQDSSVVLTINTQDYRLYCDEPKTINNYREALGIYNGEVTLDSREVKSMKVGIYIEYWDYSFTTKTVTLKPNETFQFIDENISLVKDIKVTTLSYEPDGADVCTIYLENLDDWGCYGTDIGFEISNPTNNTFNTIAIIGLGEQDVQQATIPSTTELQKRLYFSTMDFVNVSVEVTVEYYSGNEDIYSYYLTEEDNIHTIDTEGGEPIKQITMRVVDVEGY